MPFGEYIRRIHSAYSSSLASLAFSWPIHRIAVVCQTPYGPNLIFPQSLCRSYFSPNHILFGYAPARKNKSSIQSDSILCGGQPAGPLNQSAGGRALRESLEQFQAIRWARTEKTGVLRAWLSISTVNGRTKRPALSFAACNLPRDAFRRNSPFTEKTTKVFSGLHCIYPF